MSLVTINWRPDKNELRKFGTGALFMLPLIAALLAWLRHLPLTWVLCICAAGAIIFVLSRINSLLVKPVYLGLMLVSAPIGFAVSFVVLAIFYYLMLTPVGLIFKLMGRDVLANKFDKQTKTYWVTCQGPESVKRYFNQF
jgi:hypothetical protein